VRLIEPLAPLLTHWWIAGWLLLLPVNLAAQDIFDRPPISYREVSPDNAVSRLQRQLDGGQISLNYEDQWGYLRSLLSELGILESSQTLVFSKTSLQQRLIAPRNPRALYFNDDVYVGYVRSGDVLELSVADRQLGTVFYTLDQALSERPRFVQQFDDCLRCHGGSQTRGIPGHVLRSVYPDDKGLPIFSAGSFRVDHTTPWEQRWGGWYVSHVPGHARHLGNITYQRDATGDARPAESGTQPMSIEKRFSSAGYPSSHSDAVALMVLAHQSMAHNAITQAGFNVRSALHRDEALNRELGKPADHRWSSTERVLESATRALLECFLMCDEAPFPTPLGATTLFAEQFEATGPFDPEGRSLRQLDLQHRLFRYPMSYLIYTESFDALPEALRAAFWARLDAVLAGTDPQQARFSHLSDQDREAIRQILIATKTGIPPVGLWR
jgi:hypothetical protein